MKAALACALLLAVASPARAGDVTVPFTEDTSGVVPAGLKKIPGKTERVVRWSDSRGDNTAVFSAEEKTRTVRGETEWAKSIYVTVFAGPTGKPKQVRQVREIANFCPVDLTNAFVDGSVGVTDLDGDGVAELTFAYATACRGDVSPLTLKLLVLEGGEKYILRGESRVDVGEGEIMGGGFKAEFRKAPQPFLTHATALWERLAGPPSR